MKVVIAGGSGFIGRALIEEFSKGGYEVAVLSRSNKPISDAKTIPWDGKTVGPWAETLEGADAIINVVGENVFTHWTEEKKTRLMSSRVEPTEAIAQAIDQCKNPPASWVNASAVGYYGDTGDNQVTETSPPGSDFLAEICKNWEAAQAECTCQHTKKCAVRIGFVLGRDGGAFPILRKLTKSFLGSQQGSGRQWVPWIHIEDLARVFRLCVEQRLESPLNGVGPQPVTNAELMAAMRHQMHRPWAPAAPKFALAIGSLVALPPTEVTLASQRAMPARLEYLQFHYKFPTLEEAIKDLLLSAA